MKAEVDHQVWSDLDGLGVNKLSLMTLAKWR
jgi:hypothetical protein